MAIPGQITLSQPSVVMNYAGPLQITGSNFDPTCQVWINSTFCNSTLNSQTQVITAQVTAALTASAPASLPVFVTNSDGSSPPGVFLGVTVNAAKEKSAPPAAAPAMKIGILSSIPFTGTSFDRRFQLGLALPAASWVYVTKQNLKYDGTALQVLVRIQAFSNIRTNS
jgi:hypothetical protein